jgi:formylglycine-generating enzyme required for sulfatase activity
MRHCGGALVGCLFLVGSLRAAEPAGFPGTKVGQIRDDNALKMRLIWCPPGRFTMGTPANQPRLGTPYEHQVDVTLTTGLWLGRTELTQAQWKSVMGFMPWQGKDVKVKEGDDFPATYVSWPAATEFCVRLTLQEKAKGRLPEHSHYTLPTEAQWEYACRAGTTTLFSFGDDQSKIADYGWTRKYARRGRSSPNEKFAHPVAQKRPNPWGFFDMHGNATEWCRDLYTETLPGGSDPEVLNAPPGPKASDFKGSLPECGRRAVARGRAARLSRRLLRLSTSGLPIGFP